MGLNDSHLRYLKSIICQRWCPKSMENRHADCVIFNSCTTLSAAVEGFKQSQSDIERLTKENAKLNHLLGDLTEGYKEVREKLEAMVNDDKLWP